MEIAFISRPLATRIAGCTVAFVAFMASAGPAAALVASMASANPAAALDYKFLFNQTPGYRLGTIHLDGSVTYSWYLVDGRTRLDGEFEVEGLIKNLVDNQSGQIPSSIEITRADQDPLSVGTYTLTQGNGFDVRDGEIGRSFWIGIMDTPSYRRRLIFTPAWLWAEQWAEIDDGYSIYTWNEDGQKYIDCACWVSIGFPLPGSTPMFNLLGGPASSPSPSPVPGPLPILGAFGAYQASRRLRRRIQRGKEFGASFKTTSLV
jgi:hypothetical protein